MDIKKVFLLPGEICVSKEQVEISTLLGSCVAVCLHNKRYKFGGMNHYMLPNVIEGEVATCRFGDYATDMLIKKMLSFDNDSGNLESFIIGGGNVVGHLSFGGMSVGGKNIAIAQELLKKNGLEANFSDVGGDSGRKVCFKNWTGELQIRKIEKSEQTKDMESKAKELARRKIKVLIVDDSMTVRSILAGALSQDPSIEVVGMAADPYEARQMLLECDPDVICLDIIMPKMDGLTFLKKLFIYMPKPVIIISSIAQKGSKTRQDAAEIGAVEVIDKEELGLFSGREDLQRLLIDKVKKASTVWVKKKTKEELGQV